MQESRHHFKFNFTACKTSPYPLAPFLKLGNGIVWLWSYFFTFLPCNQQFAAKFSYRCNSLSCQQYVKCDTFKSNCWKWSVEKIGFQALRKGFSGPGVYNFTGSLGDPVLANVSLYPSISICKKFGRTVTCDRIMDSCEVITTLLIKAKYTVIFSVGSHSISYHEYLETIW